MEQSALDWLMAKRAVRAAPLAPKTQIKTGGIAEVLWSPSTRDDLVEWLSIAAETGAPNWVLGGGANTLVVDGLVSGVVLQLPPSWDNGAGQLSLSAGATIAKIVRLMRDGGKVGAEFLAGIPGTVGGATRMNAGTHHGDMSRIVKRVQVATSHGVGWVDAAALHYGYRHSVLPAGAIVVDVEFEFGEGDLAASELAMRTDLAYRHATQPHKWPTFGSVFANPPGVAAGKLIDEAGLKGYRVGGAQIAELHANWILNVGGATTQDVLSVMLLAQERVYGQTGLRLRPEVKLLGAIEGAEHAVFKVDSGSRSVGGR